jgi:SAM-dependent methyltransferase
VTGHVESNRREWDERSAAYAAYGRRSWAREEPAWGLWHLPERELRALPEVAGRDVVELGCGTAYWSAWLRRRGARVVGLDVSARQLAAARALQREHGLAFPLVQADAERIPLRSARFDLALSEYGASLWCDPHTWIPEAARLLRPGGELVFLRPTTLRVLCDPGGADGVVGERLQRSYFGLERLAWTDDGSIEFALPAGDWIRLFRSSGFEVLDLLELRAPADAVSSERHLTAAWAHRWPSEEIWRLRKN